MKRKIFGTFYTLQGIGHLIFIFPARVMGFNGGGMAGFDIVIKYYFIFASCFSLLTGLLLFLGLKHQFFNYLAKYLGITSSILFILFYGTLILAVAPILRLDNTFAITLSLLVLSIIVVILNLVFVGGLHSLTKNKSI